MKHPDDLTGHYFHTRGQIREGFCNTDPRLNSGPRPLTLDDPRWARARTFVCKRDGSEDDAREVTPKETRRPYVSIDIETTGIDYEYCQVLDFGAVVDDWVTPVENLPRFHAYLIHNKIVGEPKALAMNAKILDRIADRDKPECADFTFLEPDQLAGLFELWAKSHDAFGSGGSGKSLIPAGKNFQGFDRPFLKRVPRFGRVNMIHRCIDPAMLFWNPLTDAEPPSTKTCYERAGIQNEVAHTSVEDAIGIVKLIRAATIVPQVEIDSNDPRPPSAKELAHKLSSFFRRNGQFTAQK